MHFHKLVNWTLILIIEHEEAETTHFLIERGEALVFLKFEQGVASFPAKEVQGLLGCTKESPPSAMSYGAQEGARGVCPRKATGREHSIVSLFECTNVSDLCWAEVANLEKGGVLFHQALSLAQMEPVDKTGIRVLSSAQMLVCFGCVSIRSSNELPIMRRETRNAMFQIEFLTDQMCFRT